MTIKRKIENNDENNNKTILKKRKIIDDSYDNENMNMIFNNKDQFQGMMRKYWVQRYKLFSKYDEGIILTKELWFSVTPEKISKFVAKYLNDLINHYNNNNNNNNNNKEEEEEKDLNKGFKILDGFCGGGGNIVQFLSINKKNKVYAIDINTTHLECTKNNSIIYCGTDLKKRLKLLPLNWEYIKNNDNDNVNKHEIVDYIANYKQSKKTLKILAKTKFDCIFGSPPWGGPEYIKLERFDLNKLLPFPLDKMLLTMIEYSNIISLFLPKNSNIEQIKEITKTVFEKYQEVKLEIITMRVDRREKGLLVTWIVT